MLITSSYVFSDFDTSLMKEIIMGTLFTPFSCHYRAISFLCHEQELLGTLCIVLKFCLSISGLLLLTSLSVFMLLSHYIRNVSFFRTHKSSKVCGPVFFIFLVIGSSTLGCDSLDICFQLGRGIHSIYDQLFLQTNSFLLV